MSFILDALKKSESDRQRRNVPDSAHVPSGLTESSSSRWLLVIGVLLLANVLVLAIFLLKPDPPGGETDIVAGTGATAEKPASFQDIVDDSGRSQTQPAGTASKISTASIPIDAVSEDPFYDDTVASSVAAANETYSMPAGSSTANRTFNDVRLDGSVLLPDLHLDIHVWSSTRAERFVFINMSKYKENETLSEGPVVLQIVADGVVLEYRNTRFLLPRE